MAIYVATMRLLATFSCAIVGANGGVKAATSLWWDPGKISEADWEVVDVSGNPPYADMARYSAAHYKSPSGFRLAVVRVLLVERRFFDGDVKYKVIFSFSRTNCTNEEVFEENKCLPLNNETTGQCTAAVRQHEGKQDLTVDWVQCIDYV